MEELKKRAALEAAKYVKNGMILGLGTGSTAAFFVEEVARRMKDEGLELVGVTTSSVTSQQAKELGIPLKSIDEVPYVDLTVDGADEVDAQLNGIKGGGAALLMEKIVASYSKDYIWIVDNNKRVNQLGRFPLPVEVIPYGSQQLLHLFEQKGYRPALRQSDGRPLQTDTGHYIIDLHLEQIDAPDVLGEFLDKTVGVVEHGLFLGMARRVIVASPDGIATLES